MHGITTFISVWVLPCISSCCLLKVNKHAVEYFNLSILSDFYFFIAPLHNLSMHMPAYLEWPIIIYCHWCVRDMNLFYLQCMGRFYVSDFLLSMHVQNESWLCILVIFNNNYTSCTLFYLWLVHIPYSRKLSRPITFAIFAIFWDSRK